MVFGDRGKHARIAIGVASLPFDVPVEIEATFALDDGHWRLAISSPKCAGGSGLD